jgi:predicted DNA-binding transcriptional regulator AlpA
MSINPLLDEKAVAKILGLSIQTLRNDRNTKMRIPFIKIGRSVRYRIEDIEDLIESNRIVGRGDKD